MSALPRRSMVRGFVGKDGQTHAEDREARGGVTKLAKCDRIELYWPRCPMNPASDEVPFIANPKHPLCRACVDAIEKEIRRD